MSMRFLLLALASIMLLAAACGGDNELVKNADGLYVIERLNLKGGSYEIGYQDRIVPALSSPYPAGVAVVNGELITGAMLTLKQVELAVQLQHFPELMEQSGAPDELLGIAEDAFENADPLELLIEDVLLQQAAVRLGYEVSYEEALEIARERDAVTEAMMAEASPEILLFAEDRRRLGFPDGNMAADPFSVAEFREAKSNSDLREAECDQTEPSSDIENFDPIRTGPDCTAFLAAERENAAVEYFVVWAE